MILGFSQVHVGMATYRDYFVDNLNLSVPVKDFFGSVFLGLPSKCK